MTVSDTCSFRRRYKLGLYHRLAQSLQAVDQYRHTTPTFCISWLLNLPYLPNKLLCPRVNHSKIEQKDHYYRILDQRIQSNTLRRNYVLPTYDQQGKNVD